MTHYLLAALVGAFAAALTLLALLHVLSWLLMRWASANF